MCVILLEIVDKIMTMKSWRYKHWFTVSVVTYMYVHVVKSVNLIEFMNIGAYANSLTKVKCIVKAVLVGCGSEFICPISQTFSQMYTDYHIYKLFTITEFPLSCCFVTSYCCGSI